MADLLPFVVYKFNIYIYIYMKVPTTHLQCVGIQNHFALLNSNNKIVLMKRCNVSKEKWNTKNTCQFKNIKF